MNDPDQRTIQSPASREEDRGLSDAVTVLLLIGIAVIAVGLIGVFVFDLIPTGGDSVQASLDFDQTGDDPANVSVFHAGGDPLPNDVTVETTGDANVTSIGELGGLSSGQEAIVELDDGNEDDRISVVHRGSVIASFELFHDVND